MNNNIIIYYIQTYNKEIGKIDEREFRAAYKELKISRMDTNDRIRFDNLK